MSITIDAARVDLYKKVRDRLSIVEDDIIKFCQSLK